MLAHAVVAQVAVEAAAAEVAAAEAMTSVAEVTEVTVAAHTASATAVGMQSLESALPLPPDHYSFGATHGSVVEADS